MSNESTLFQKFNAWQSIAFDMEQCPLGHMLNHVGGKWTFLTVLILGEGPRRFGELNRSMPDISKKMLTYTLRSLERDGLVARRVFPTKPPSVEYCLTSVGRSLLHPVSVLMQWAERNEARFREARLQFDASNEPVKPIAQGYSRPRSAAHANPLRDRRV
jgi:DNA-binding HxlR family transcriptional regulator